MKFSTSFVVWALASTACIAKKTVRERRSDRRKNKVGRHLSLSYLVNHDVVEEETGEVEGRASIAFGEEPIIGVYFQPIYRDSDLANELNTGLYANPIPAPPTPPDAPDNPNTSDVSREKEQTLAPTNESTPAASPRTSPKTTAPKVGQNQMGNGTGGGNGIAKNPGSGPGNGHGGVSKPGTGTGGDAKRTGTGTGTSTGNGAGGGAKRTGTGTRGGGAKRGVYKKVTGTGSGTGVNRNGSGSGTGSGQMRKRYVRHFSKGANGAHPNGTNRNGSNTGSKSGSKSGSKEGSKSGSSGSSGGSQKNVGGECRLQCQNVPYSTDSYNPYSCDATSVLNWMEIAEDNCCCSGGISFLKLQFSTDFYSNTLLAGSFYVDKTVETTIETTIDTVSTRTDTIDTSIDVNVDISNARNGYKTRNGISGRADGTVDSIYIVDCDDECVTNPMGNRPCTTATEIQDRITTGTDICFLQLDDSDLPRFDWNFPDTLNFVFESTVQEIFNVAVDTTCGVPVVSPWALMAFPSGQTPIPSPINTYQPQAEEFNFPIFRFMGGMSTGSFTTALNNPFQQAGYQLDLDQCGCDCSDYPPTEAPSSLRDYETDTLPPTMDFSCQPSSSTDGDSKVIGEPDTNSPTVIFREMAPIGFIGTEDRENTGAPTLLFSIPSPVAPPIAATITTSWPTRNPVAPLTAVPTIKPTVQPTVQPTDQPTNEPTNQPTDRTTVPPTNFPTRKPTELPTTSPSDIPTCTDAPDVEMAQVEETYTAPQPNTCNAFGATSICKFHCSFSSDQCVPLNMFITAVIVFPLCS